MSDDDIDIVPHFDSTERRPVADPIEIRLHNPRLGVHTFVLVAWVDDQGVIGHYMTKNGAGIPESLSNLQSKGVIWPGKAVPGWQDEAIAYAGAGLYEVVEVR